jgi:hypothetical protein
LLQVAVLVDEVELLLLLTAQVAEAVRVVY